MESTQCKLTATNCVSCNGNSVFKFPNIGCKDLIFCKDCGVFTGSTLLTISYYGQEKELMFDYLWEENAPLSEDSIEISGIYDFSKEEQSVIKDSILEQIESALLALEAWKKEECL